MNNWFNMDDDAVEDYMTNINPSDFYFAFEKDEELGLTVNVILKDVWDSDKSWDGLSLASNWLEKRDIFELQENVYELYNISEDEVRRMLTEAGFTENPDILV